MATGADKRRSQRFPIALPVDLRVEEKGTAEPIVKTRDISSSGVYLEFSTPMDVGSSLEFVLTLPAEITKGQAVRVKCLGKVIRGKRFLKKPAGGLNRPVRTSHAVRVARHVEHPELRVEQ